MSKQQQFLPGFELPETYHCPLCGEERTFFGQFAPHLPYYVCRDCSIRYNYPAHLFLPNARRNSDKNPFMIDPNSTFQERERRIVLDELIKNAMMPTRITRPVVKLNVTGLEVMNPVRRSRMQQFNRMSSSMNVRMAHRQMHMPLCERCGCAHDRAYGMGAHTDYWATCQRCADELEVEALMRVRGIFGADDDETIIDRLYASPAHKHLFERGVLPDYWYALSIKQ